MQQFLDMENQTHNTLGASPCEAELQELMEQIDIMVNNKKLDWERKMRALETRLDLRDQELANAQTCLEQKGQEVGLLRQKLDSLEKCNLAMTQNYEGQLQTLKAQKQAQSYHTQLNGKKQSIEDSSPEIPRLVCEPDSTCETSERDEFIIEKLKSAVSEIALSRNKLQDENQKLLQELKMYQRQCQIRSHLYQEEEYHSSEQERMRNEISDLTQELHQKEITIATVMKKAALLERQLKMELEIKEKMLSKQQMLDTRYKAVRTENTHLKGMMGDLDPGRYMTSGITDIKSVDFTNREHSRHTSINKLEYENERLRNDLAKLHASGKSTWANVNTYEEAGRFNHDREPNRSTTPPLPSSPFQTKEITSPLVSDEEVFPMSPPDISFPASLATQHFLLEEEKRAKELEKLLNTHIDELQRHTEFTLNKYTKLKQDRHI
uniref:Deuterosome assembly protein 1 n=1 Tax=Bos indicus x Bos taurus TaxID=30522 RepID=A0A4W2BLQ6_BOBOX